ncbi:MAG TPA: lysylphosphatidylglycerol synthase transmembrane domain-containing protein [Candidatus Dormibacteraeota bacterium]|nr:lysylphosphatidylglycerol synthase transmembrane domain-containing protein [Candidatus Dormibacteraeota bacterium]
MTRRRWIQAVVLLAVGLLILYGLLRTVHPSEVGAAIRGASWGWILLGMLSSIVFIAIRSWRWQVILAASSPHARLDDAAAVTAVGFGVNSVSPFKLGELLRIGAIAQRTDIGLGEAGATVVLERILDVLALLILALAAAALSGKRSSAGGIWQGLAVLSGISLAVGVFAYVMALNHQRTMAVVEWLSGRVPMRFRRAFVELSASILRGLELLRSPGRFALTGLLSLVIWIVPTLGLVAYVRSVSGALSLTTLYLALTLFVISQAVSITPGSVGTYEGFFVLILSAFHAGPASLLTAAAVISHIGGIVALLAAGAVGALWLRVNRASLPVRAQRPVPS